MFKIGDEVYIASTSIYYGGTQLSNPINVKGKISAINPLGHIVVKWPEHSNGYIAEDLTYINPKVDEPVCVSTTGESTKYQQSNPKWQEFLRKLYKMSQDCRLPSRNLTTTYYKECREYLIIHKVE